MRAWSAGLMPGPVSRTATVNVPSAADALIGDLAGVGELDRIADQVEQHLRDTTLVAVSGGRCGGISVSNARRLLGCQRLDAR